MHYVPPDRFELLSGTDHLAEYRFSSQSTGHHFCDVCGIFTHFESRWAGNHHFAVNVACIDGVNPYELESEILDGAAIPIES